MHPVYSIFVTYMGMERNKETPTLRSIMPYIEHQPFPLDWTPIYSSFPATHDVYNYFINQPERKKTELRLINDACKLLTILRYLCVPVCLSSSRLIIHINTINKVGPFQIILKKNRTQSLLDNMFL